MAIGLLLETSFTRAIWKEDKKRQIVVYQDARIYRNPWHALNLQKMRTQHSPPTLFKHFVIILPTLGKVSEGLLNSTFLRAWGVCVCRGLAMLMAASRCSRAPKAGVDEITVAGKAGNLLHSAEEIDINECLIAGEEILTAANTPQVVEKKNHTHIRMHTQRGGTVNILHTCWCTVCPNAQVAGTLPDTHTHTADETFTALILKYYQDFQLLSLTPSLTSLPVSPSTPPLLHLMCLKKETAHSILQRDWERNIYKNISPAARIDLADLLGSRPPSFHLLLCRSLQLCPQTRTNNLPAILDPQFCFVFFALPPTLFCPGSQSRLSTSSQALSFILLNNWTNLAVWENIRQSVTAWRMWTWCSRRYVKCNPLLTFISSSMS